MGRERSAKLNSSHIPPHKQSLTWHQLLPMKGLKLFEYSEYGYGAVLYLRIVNDKGVPHCSFVLGKSHVTPLKVVSIPRLELTAAVVAVKLNCLIWNELEYPIHDTIYWTAHVHCKHSRNDTG